jgi:DNA-binding NarL/FixJ family response regulator
MSLRRILFVDDEPLVLKALRNLLRRQRDVWEMVFVGSGHEALDELSRAAFDVVVSDMRMPVMDGAELVGRVNAQWPQTACLVLSGYADPEARARAMASARGCLSKPCAFEELKAAIEACG